MSDSFSLEHWKGSIPSWLANKFEDYEFPYSFYSQAERLGIQWQVIGKSLLDSYVVPFGDIPPEKQQQLIEDYKKSLGEFDNPNITGLLDSEGLWNFIEDFSITVIHGYLSFFENNSPRLRRNSEYSFQPGIEKLNETGNKLFGSREFVGEIYYQLDIQKFHSDKSSEDGYLAIRRSPTEFLSNLNENELIKGIIIGSLILFLMSIFPQSLTLIPGFPILSEKAIELLIATPVANWATNFMLSLSILFSSLFELCKMELDEKIVYSIVHHILANCDHCSNKEIVDMLTSIENQPHYHLNRLRIGNGEFLVVVNGQTGRRWKRRKRILTMWPKKIESRILALPFIYNNEGNLLFIRRSYSTFDIHKIVSDTRHNISELIQVLVSRDVIEVSGSKIVDCKSFYPED